MKNYKNYMGLKVHEVKLDFYAKASDFMGMPKKNLAILLDCLDEEGEEGRGVITVNFGEFIGMKDSAYIDTNNYPGIIEWLTSEGFGDVTSYFKRSGFCEYPLFHFNPEVLKELDAEKYEEYASQYEFEDIE